MAWAMSPKEKLVLQYLKALEQVTSVSPFTNQTAISALKDKLGLNQNTYRDSVNQKIYDELDPSKSNTTNRYKVLSMAFAVSQTGNNGYDYGKQFIKANTSPSLEEKLSVEARLIAVPLYRNYLETGVAAHSDTNVNLLELLNDPEFCEGFARRILDPEFINDQLISIYTGGTPAFAEAVAYTYERCRSTLLNTKTSKDTAIAAMKSARDHWLPFAKEHSAFASKPEEIEAFLVKSYPLEWSDESLLQPPSFRAIGDSFNTEFIRTQYIHDIAQNACNTQEEQMGTVYPGLHGTPVPPPIETTYGKDLVNWMNSLAANGYDDIFNRGDAHTSWHTPSPFSSCFAPGTMVRTGSQEDKPIELLTPGERILSKAPSAYGILSDEQVVAPTNPLGKSELWTTWLYGFNDEKPFFTAGHVFFTKAGPKAVSPDTAHQENPGIRVHELCVGDVLFRLSGNPKKPKYEEIVVKNLTIEQAKCSAVYGLHFRKGDKAECTYHANGYLVGLNYAETTLKRLKDNYGNLSLKEQRKFVESLPEIPATLRKVFGPSLVNAFEASFNKPTSQLASFHETQKQQHKHRTNKRHLHASALVRKFPLVHWDRFQGSQLMLHSHASDYKERIAAINGHNKLPEVVISHGAVLIDGELAPHARVTQKEVHWSRPLSNGQWEHGLLKTSADGTFVHGHIAKGESPLAQSAAAKSTPSTTVQATGVKAAAAKAVSLKSVTPVVGASHANDYQVQTTIAGQGGPGTFATSKDANAVVYPASYNWGSFHKVEIGLTMKPDGSVAVVTTLPDVDSLSSDPDAPKFYVATSALDTEKFILVVTVTIADGVEDIIMDPDAGVDFGIPFYQFLMKVNLATNVVTGYYSELKNSGTDDNHIWGPGSYHPLFCPYSPKVAAARANVLSKIASNPHTETDGAALALKTDFHSPSANIHLDPSPAVITALAAVAADAYDNLPIGYLQTMATPADADLHASSQTYMISAAGYWRGDDEINIFGNDRPGLEKTLPDSLKGQLPANLQAFLRDHFSKHLLLYSLSRNNNYESKFDDNRKDKLQFWWTGKTTNCLSHKKEYNDVTVITAGQAFLDLADDNFKHYIQSSRDYAQDFLTAVTDDDILQNLALSVILGNQNLVNRYCAILNALDKQHRALDTQLWQMVRDKQIFTMSAGSPEYGDDWSEFAQEFIKILDDKIAHGDPSISDDMRNELGLDLDQLKQELDAKDAVDLGFKMFSSATDLGQNILSIMNQFKRRPSRGGQANAPNFLKALGAKLGKSKLFTALKGIIMVGMQAYTVYQSITFLLDWKNLSDAQRAVGILTCVEATLRGIYDLAQTYKQLRGLPVDSLDFRLGCVRWNNASAKKVKMEAEDNTKPIEPVLDEKQAASVPRIDENGGINEEIPEKSMTQQIAEKGASTETEAAKALEGTFSLSEAAVEGVLVALNIAMVVMMGQELKNEWDHVPDGIRAMDTINLIVQCAQVVTGVIGLGAMVVGAELSCLPIVGVLVVLAGLIMTLVETFVPHPKPDPIQDYLNAHGYSYIDPLDDSPVPVLTYTTTHSVSGTQLTLDIAVSQPPHPTIDPPMISSLFVKVYAGSTDTDAFLAPTTDDDHNVTKDNIVWSIVDGNGTFDVAQANNPDPNDHSLLGRVSPVTAPVTNEDKTITPGSSVLGANTLKIRIVGTLNPAFKSMEGQVTEILYNAPKETASTDVISKFTVSK